MASYAAFSGASAVSLNGRLPYSTTPTGCADENDAGRTARPCILDVRNRKVKSKGREMKRLRAQPKRRLPGDDLIKMKEGT
jgi:hypothetical protein